MKSISNIVFVLLFSVQHLNGQDVDRDSMYINKSLLIILSTKKYSTALEFAKKASKYLDIKTDLRNLQENKQIGLSLSKEDCEKEGIEYPAYYARGRWDDGIYISIEFSTAYRGFAKGYYIVIVASGDKANNDIKAVCTKVKAKYKDAYFKTTKVYIGCMH